jgi:UDP-N-acetylmuramoyl-L-alanyl-D-glutamate--2,6-diaminopimelate ligase
MNELLQKYSVTITTKTKVGWKTENSDPDTILFYNFQNNSEENWATFYARIKNAKFSYCFINSNRASNLPNVINVDVSDWLPLQKELCDKIYPLNQPFKSIAVTGTNGKTTTVDLIRQISIQQSRNVLTIGTLGVWYNEIKVNDFSLTSPAYIDFRKTLYQYASKIDILALEVSSHALDQQRYYKFLFDIGIWTNFTQDHLDYHLSIENYFHAKEKLFEIVKVGVLVCEDEQSILSRLSTKNPIVVERIENLPDGFLTVDYNKKNISLAIAALKKLDMLSKEIKFNELISPPGRFNVIDTAKGKVVIDFAHTPDALLNICKAIRKSFYGMQLITVFGCGGDRDRTKRPLMGSIASENSDYIFLTNDNPRFENPEVIIDDIKNGITKNNFTICLQREDAIKEAYRLLDNGVLLIAGKGHEDYMEIKGERIPYSDLDIVKRIINAYERNV